MSKKSSCLKKQIPSISSFSMSKNQDTTLYFINKNKQSMKQDCILTNEGIIKRRTVKILTGFQYTVHSNKISGLTPLALILSFLSFKACLNKKHNQVDI